MVALNTAYAAPKNAAAPKNRAGDFFYEDHASDGKNRWAKCLNTQEKSSYHYETASGRSNWPNRDPVSDQGHELRIAPRIKYQKDLVIGEISRALATAKTARNKLSSQRYSSPQDFVRDVQTAILNELKAFKQLPRLQFLEALSFYRGSIAKAQSGVSMYDRAGVELYQFMRNQPIIGIEFLGLDVMETVRDANLSWDLNIANHYNVFVETDRTNDSGEQLNYIVSGSNQTLEASLEEGSTVMDYFERLQDLYDYSWPTNDCGEVIDWATWFLDAARNQ
jgi:hypothetical protein